MSTHSDYSRDSYPANKHILQAVGGIKGHLLCRIFWATNLKDGVCRMGITRLGEEIGFDRSTVLRNEKLLIAEGYIKEIKPADPANGQPAHYQVTQKFYDLLPADEKPVPVAQRNTPVVDCNTPPVAQCNRDIDFIADIESNIDISEATPQPPTPKSKKPVKPKEEQPPKPEAVKVYKSVLCRWPNKALDNIIGDTVGNDPEALILWENVVRGWIATGWNPGNVKGMLECFGRREIPGTHKPNGNGNGITAKQAANKTANEAMRYAWNFKKHCYYDTWEMVDLTEEEYQNAMSKM
jgi:hypothetical protein